MIQSYSGEKKIDVSLNKIKVKNVISNVTWLVFIQDWLTYIIRHTHEHNSRRTVKKYVQLRSELRSSQEPLQGRSEGDLITRTFEI